MEAATRVQETEFSKYLSLTLEAGADDEEDWRPVSGYLKHFAAAAGDGDDTTPTWLQSRDAQGLFTAMRTILGDRRNAETLKRAIEVLQKNSKAAAIFSPGGGKKAGKAVTKSLRLLEIASEELRRSASDGVYKA